MLLRKKSSSGFTLIELLVAISIISVLIAMGTVYYTGAQEKAMEVKVKANFDKIFKTFEQERVAQSKNFGQVTGSFCTECSCRTDPSSQGCKDAVTAAWDNVSSEAILYDPWGRPYMWDENEQEYSSSDCRIDFLRSVGKDGIYGTGDDKIYYLTPMFCP